jgi:hypothetical protein
LRGKTGAFLAQSDAILFLAANRSFVAGEERANSPFHEKNEILWGRNEAPPEADSSDTANGYESENHLFSFCQSAQGSRKTAQCCLENLRVRATLRQTAVNSHPERFQTKREKLYESEKRTELIQTTLTLLAPYVW